MANAELIDNLNRALSLELAGVIQYLQHSFLVTGQDREVFRGFFRDMSKESRKHAELLGDKVLVRRKQLDSVSLRFADARIHDAHQREVGMIVHVAPADLPHVSVADDPGTQRCGHAAPRVRSNSSRWRTSLCSNCSTAGTSSGRSTPTVR